MIEQEAILNIIFEAKGLVESMPPGVFLIPDRDRTWAYQKLALDESDVAPEYISEPISDLHRIVLCNVSPF